MSHEPAAAGMKYSLDGGTTKTTITTTTNISVSAGDKVQFYGNGTSTKNYGLDTEVKIQGSGDGFQCKVYGNIMSLLDETDYAQKTTLPDGEDCVFYGLFKNNTTLTDASGLLLPAMTLTQECYEEMFYGCTNLTAAPALPATTLASFCYDTMFHACSSLTTAPVLPATTLVEYCYGTMFEGCTHLSSVTCLATSGINTNVSTNGWLFNAGKNVIGTKTFTAASGAEWPTNSDSGIPSGWTRVNQ